MRRGALVDTRDMNPFPDINVPVTNVTIRYKPFFSLMVPQAILNIQVLGNARSPDSPTVYDFSLRYTNPNTGRKVQLIIRRTDWVKPSLEPDANVSINGNTVLSTDPELRPQDGVKIDLRDLDFLAPQEVADALIAGSTSGAMEVYNRLANSDSLALARILADECASVEDQLSNKTVEQLRALAARAGLQPLTALRKRDLCVLLSQYMAMHPHGPEAGLAEFVFRAQKRRQQ